MYQLFIGGSILVSTFFGKTLRNIVILLASIFTFCNVFTEKLMVLQFVTILFSFLLSKMFLPDENSKIENSKILFERGRKTDKELKDKENSSNSLSIVFIIVIIILGIIFSQYNKK